MNILEMLDYGSPSWKQYQGLWKAYVQVYHICRHTSQDHQWKQLFCDCFQQLVNQQSDISDDV